MMKTMKAQVIQNGFGNDAEKVEDGSDYEYKAELVEHTNYPHKGTHLEAEAEIYLNDEFGWVNAQIYDANKDGNVKVQLSVCEYTEKGRIEAVFSPNEVQSEIVDFFNKEQEKREKEIAQQDEYRRSQMYNY